MTGKKSPEDRGRPSTTVRQHPAPRGAVASRRNTLRPAGNGWLLILGVLVVVALLRLGAVLAFGTNPLLIRPVLEDAAYQSRVIEIHSGILGSTTLPRGSALYPLLCSSIPGIAQGGSRPLGVAQALMEGLTALVLMLWIRRRWGLKPALAAGLLYGLDPLGAFFAARFSPVTPAVLAFVGALWLLDRGLGRRGLGSAALFGFVSLLGFLLLPLPFAGLALLWGYAVFTLHSVALGGDAGRKSGPPPASASGAEDARAGAAGGPRPASAARGRIPIRGWAEMLLPIALILAVSAALALKNSTLHDGGPVLAWGGGPAIDHAFNPETGGTPRALTPPTWAPESSLASETWENLGHEGTHYDIYRYYLSRGLKRAIGNPLATIGVLLAKGIETLEAWPVPDDLSAGFLAGRSARLFSYLSVSFAVLLALAAAGFMLVKGDRTWRILTLGLIAVAFASLFGMTSAASRQAAIPLLAALGAAWITGAGGRSALRLRRASVVPLGAALVLSLLFGLISPAARLRNRAEDLRLLASQFGEDNRQAVPLLEEAVRINPRDLDARVALAAGYQRDGLMDAALDQLKQGFQIDSTHVGVLFALSSLQEKRGNKDVARREMARLVQLHPTNPLYLNELGLLLADNGDMAGAQDALTRALALKPDYEVAQRNLQTLSSYQQQLENMLVPADMRLAPTDSTQALFADAGAALEREDWSRADSLIRLSERARPNFVQPHWLRAGYWARKGSIDRAISELEICCRLAPGRPMVVQQLATLYHQTGRGQEIEPLLRASLEAAAGDSVRVKSFQAMLAELNKNKP